jgi:hypothetical protein
MNNELSNLSSDRMAISSEYMQTLDQLEEVKLELKK